MDGVDLVREVGDILELALANSTPAIEVIAAGAEPGEIELSINPPGSRRGELRAVRWFAEAEPAERMIAALCGAPLVALLEATSGLRLLRGVGVALRSRRAASARVYLVAPPGDSRPLLRWVERTAIGGVARELVAAAGGESRFVGYGIEASTIFDGIGEVLRRTTYVDVAERARALALVEAAGVVDEPVARSFFVDLLGIDVPGGSARPLLVARSTGPAASGYKFYYNVRLDPDRPDDVELLERLDLDAVVSLAWAELRNRLPAATDNLVSTIGLRPGEPSELTVYLWGRQAP